MKTHILLFIAISAVISSCDVIEPPYTTNNGQDTTSQQVVQKVYVEYFTGHRCVNCPTEAAQLKHLKSIYGDKLIFISVHAGAFAAPSSPNYEVDYRTTTGNELDSYFNVTAISTPNSLINRKEYEGNVVLAPAAWAGAIAAELLRIPEAAIYLNPTLSGNNIIIEGGIKPLVQIDGTFMVSAYIVEDSILSFQKNNNPEIGTTPDISDYYHRYMLRASMNGTFGDTLFSTVALPSDSFTVSYSTPADPSWNTSKLYVVCFVYNKETDEVLQVEMKKVE
jgi:hypothetical protein